jgi:hypothetical protein
MRETRAFLRRQRRSSGVGRGWRFEESDIQDYIQKQRDKAATARNEQVVASVRKDPLAKLHLFRLQLDRRQNI